MYFLMSEHCVFVSLCLLNGGYEFDFFAVYYVVLVCVGKQKEIPFGNMQ